jgi:hypothetical protein
MQERWEMVLFMFNFEKTHIPCHHLLKVIDRIGPYIGDFWRKNYKLMSKLNKIPRRITHKKRLAS